MQRHVAELRDHKEETGGDADTTRAHVLDKLAQLVPGVEGPKPEKEKSAAVKALLESWTAAIKEKRASEQVKPTERTLSALLGGGAK